MRATYQEITDKMRAAFFDACGEKPEDLPELDARFRSVATELYALSVFGDHVQSQVFADTARGADLDRHAADVGLQRKGASAAAGVLTFSLAQAAEAAVTVPADTVCSVAGQPYLQFATTKAATIPAGEWTVDVPAVSLGKTTAHNVEPGCITVMVNPPAGIRGVTNANRFSGGAAVETDTALRQRICQVQQVPPNGVNTACLAAAVEQLDRVLSCKVCPGGSDYIVTVYVRSRQGQVDDELRLAVTEKLDILTLAGCFIDVQEAKKQPVQLVCSAQILAGADPATVRSALENQLKELCSARVIGGSLHPSALAAAPVRHPGGACGRRKRRRDPLQHRRVPGGYGGGGDLLCLRRCWAVCRHWRRQRALTRNRAR